MTGPHSGAGLAQQGRTRAEILANRLAEDIVGGRFKPGEALDEVGIAGAFGVSRTPVREAVRQLAAIGLVEIRPHRAPIVAKPDERTLREMFAVMAELEALAAGSAAAAMTPGERHALEAHHLAMRALVQAGDTAGYRDANTVFHRMIAELSHNAYLAELTAATQRRLAPFRRAQFDASVDRLTRSHDEHGAIVTAILRGDSDGASRAMRTHIGLSGRAWELLGRRLAAA
ncbi:GntR family transcriptional regulator [Alsobacter sp. R-9]